MLARDHHYLFTHTHLRNQALRDPDKVLSELGKPMHEAFLYFLWEQVEGVASTHVDGAGLGVEGLDTLGAGQLALVRMPTPEMPTESFYAAIYRGPAGARYFVFDRAASDPEQATLAELELDETRISLGLHPATKEALLEALLAELTGPVSQPPAPISQAPISQAPISQAPPSHPGAFAPTQAMPSSAGAFGPMPGQQTHAPMSGVGGPMLGAQPGKKKSRKHLLWLLAIPFVAPVFCCLAVGFMGYESGLEEDASFEVTTEVTITETDAEQLVITITGPEHMDSYRVEGPGAEECGYLYSYSFRRGVTCTVNLAGLADASPSYVVSASGHGDRLFGEDLDDRRSFEQTIEVQRTLALAWSERSNTTVVRGFPGRLQVTNDGFLRLTGAPAGSTLIVGPDSSSEPEPLIGLDLVALTNQVGVSAVLRDGGRVTVENVTVRQADGTQAMGSALFEATDLGPALAHRFALLGDADLGEAGGEAALFLEDGRVRQILGAPRNLSDVGRVVVIENREARTGRCGPYALYGIGYGSRIPRMRWMADVTAYDRVEQRRIARRTFRGSRPDCPYSIQQGTRAIHGRRDTGADADEYARGHLTPDTES